MNRRERQRLIADEPIVIPSMPLSEADRALFGAIANAEGVTVASDGSVKFGAFVLTSKGIRVEGMATAEDWERLGGHLRLVSRSMQWIIGDWMAIGDRSWGKTYEQASQLVGRSVKTLYNWSYVCANVDFSRRREKSLTFTHHAAVAALPGEAQERWLSLAEAGKWASRKLELEIEKARLGAGDPAAQAETGPQRLFDERDARRVKRVLTWTTDTLTDKRRRGELLDELDQVERKIAEIRRHLQER